jgi:hypothetical protein
MKSSVKLVPTRWDALVAAAIVLLAVLCGGGYRALALSAGGGLTAVVSVDGQERDRVRLDALAAPETRRYANNGYTLTVEFSADGVRAAEADCPNQDCVHTGTVSGPGRSVVCLPARISVQITASAADGPDVVIG